MAFNLNVVCLVGNISKDIEKNYYNDLCIVKFSIAINSSRKVDNQWQDVASFFDITYIGKLAESISPYLKKGTQVAIQGELKQDRWTDKETGSNRSKIYIQATNIQLVGSRPSENSNNSNNNYNDSNNSNNNYNNSNNSNNNKKSSSIDDDDPIPF